MTQSEQRTIVELFNEGHHKVIFATSVADEGIDISSCNLVILYEYVTNEIVRTQARGWLNGVRLNVW